MIFWFPLVVFAVLGAVFGSFINCALYRVPRGISLRNPPSHCPACNNRLGVLDLFPLFSYLVLRGKCRYCGEKFSSYYFWTEVTSTSLALLAIFIFGLTLQAILGATLLLSLQFSIQLYVQSKQVPLKVLLFSFILIAIMFLLS